MNDGYWSFGKIDIPIFESFTLPTVKYDFIYQIVDKLKAFSDFESSSLEKDDLKEIARILGWPP